MTEHQPRETNPTRKKNRTIQEELQELRTGLLIHNALQDVLQKVSAIGAEVGQSSAKLDVIKPKLESIETQTTKTNGRVTSLEIWQAKSTGVMAAIAAMGGLIGWAVAQVIAFVKQ
jgi:uncharacterized protein YigA (DUF484 family)